MRQLVWQGMAVVLLLAGGARAADEASRGEIRKVLDEQVAAWNRGDLDSFMTSYWHSPQTTFVGSSGVFRGWQGVLDRYRKTYPDRATMGKVRFSSLEITMLSPEAALVLGHFHLERASGPAGGVFSLVFRRFPEGWKIILDHTSAMNPPPAD